VIETPGEWGEFPVARNLKSGHVDVWRLNLDVSTATEQAFRMVLSPEEIERADRFIRKEHGLRFTVGRGALRYLLGQYCSLGPSDIEFSYGEFGKPSLTESDHGIQFNVSNTSSLGAISLTLDQSVGVDIERNRERLELEKLARRYFSPTEVEVLFALDTEQIVRAFYRCWSSKEAFMKVSGRGLSLGLNRFDVEVDPAQPPRVLRVPEELGPVDQWEMVALPMGDEVAGVLALEGRIEKVNLYALDPASLLNVSD
jgi:4'-phosphopantetheinyl transferase